jgi:hypothetical protein
MGSSPVAYYVKGFAELLQIERGKLTGRVSAPSTAEINQVFARRIDAPTRVLRLGESHGRD